MPKISANCQPGRTTFVSPNRAAHNWILCPFRAIPDSATNPLINKAAAPNWEPPHGFRITAYFAGWSPLTTSNKSSPTVLVFAIASAMGMLLMVVPFSTTNCPKPP